MEKLRVIQWTTGKVGKLATRAILDDPRLELVGMYAYSPDKVGKDAGALCGRADTGITASSDIDALLALKADTVIYTPFMADLSHAIRLLENGSDIISTNLFMNLGGVQGDVREQLEAACKRGNASLFISGINPGWVNSIAVALTAVCRRIDCVAVTESANCAVYESVETWTILGMGQPEASAEVIQSARDWMVMFRDTVFRMAEALGYTLDDAVLDVDYAKAAEDIDLGWFRMGKGTNAALRATWSGKVNGKTVLQNTVVWYLTKKLQEAWELDDDQYHIAVKGDPDLNMRLRFTPPEHWKNHDWDTLTALPAVSSAFAVKSARPGVLGVMDVGLPAAPAGVWTSK